MTERVTWKQLREQRMASPTARAAYEEARLAYEVGRQVRALREAQGLSQRELADRLGTTAAAIARLEAGSTRPTLITLERVAVALGAKIEVRLEREEAVAS
jgi:ribosome-binding protein aMBF1 (putative translation factor)